MLILCSGPDTLSARQKARELAEAFRVKHDPSGFSIETMREPDLVAILQKLSAPSFFSAKRFIRCDGLLDALKIAEVRTLLAKLEIDKDQTIIVSVEDELPATKVVDECKKFSFFQYTYPLLVGEKFLSWCTKRAQELGATDADAKTVARYAEGDAWLAEQELLKRAANPNSQLAETSDEPGSVFDVAEKYLKQSDWRMASRDQDPDQLLQTLVSQSRAFVRVRDHETRGLHPFVVKKLERLGGKNADTLFARVLKTFFSTRSGLSQSSEIETRL